MRELDFFNLPLVPISYQHSAALDIMAGQQQVFYMNSAPERQSGRKAQLSNISAAKVSRLIVEEGHESLQPPY